MSLHSFLTKMDDDETLSKVTRGIHTDCLLNYETVKYFGGEEHEGERYREAIREYQTLEYKVTSLCSYCLHFLLLLKLLSVSLNLLNLVQNFIIVSKFYYFIMLTKTKIALSQTLGLLIGSLMVAYETTSGGVPQASKFVMFITYLAQVSGNFRFSPGELDLVYESSCTAP